MSSKPRVTFRVIRHGIYLPKISEPNTAQTPGADIELTYDLGDEVAAFIVLRDAIAEAQALMDEIMARQTPSTAQDLSWNKMKEPPADDSWLTTQNDYPKKHADTTIIGNWKWWKRK